MIGHARNDRVRVRGRLMLLFPLAGLLILGGILITQAPTDTSRGTSGAWLSGNNRYAVFYNEAFLVGDWLVVTSDRYGYSVQFLDFSTGKLIGEIKPLVWLVYLLITLIILYAVWCVAWMVVSRAKGDGLGWT